MSIINIKNHLINIDKLSHARLDLLPNDGPWPSNIYFTFPTHSFAICFDKQKEAQDAFDLIVKEINE